MIASAFTLLPSLISRWFTVNSLPSRTRCWLPPSASTANFFPSEILGFAAFTGFIAFTAFAIFLLLSISSRLYQVPIQPQGFAGELSGRKERQPPYFRRGR